MLNLNEVIHDHPGEASYATQANAQRKLDRTREIIPDSFEGRGTLTVVIQSTRNGRYYPVVINPTDVMPAHHGILIVGRIG